MMLAMRLQANVAEHYDLVVSSRLLERPLEDGDGSHGVTGIDLLICTPDTVRRGKQPCAIRIVAGPFNQCSDSRFRSVPIGALARMLWLEMCAACIHPWHR